MSRRAAKSVVTPTNIPGCDYVVNPYVGCQHGCIYCYAVFMIRFTGHKGQKWGEFVDVKEFDFSKIRGDEYAGKCVLFSSVTDPYQPIERKVRNTRRILERFVGSEARVDILSKSALLERDIDLFRGIPNARVGVSLSTLDPSIARALEPFASAPRARLKALRAVHGAGVHTFLFVSPFFPGITDYEGILDEAHPFVDEVWFENLNFRPHNRHPLFQFLADQFPELVPKYRALADDPTGWDPIEREIQESCELAGIEYSIEFHHGGFS
ncbi:MAG: radical SAM protein [Promethearchaeota archaeon]